MENKNNPLALKISIILIASIPVQLLFWSLYHIGRAGGSLDSGQLLGLLVFGGIYVVLAFGLSKRKKWTHRLSVIFLALMSLTSVVKLARGLSEPSFGYLVFLATYLASVTFLLTPSVRTAFRSSK